MSNASKQATVEDQVLDYLLDPNERLERLQRSNQEIAGFLGCKPQTVAKVRDRVTGPHGGLRVELPLSVVNRDRRLQARVCRGGYDPDTVARYLAVLSDGGALPHVVVHQIGAELYLTDGWQRFRAYERSGATEIPCEVVVGTWEDAVLFACQANEAHGLPRTNEDRRRAVTLALTEVPSLRRQSRRKIAKAASVTEFLVRTMIREGFLIAGKDDDGEYVRPATPAERARAEAALVEEAEAEAGSDDETLEPDEGRDLDLPGDPGSTPDILDESADEDESEPDDADDDAEVVEEDSIFEQVQAVAINCPSYEALSKPGRGAQLRALYRDIYLILLTERERDAFAKAYKNALKEANTHFPRIDKRTGGKSESFMDLFAKLQHPTKHPLCDQCAGDGCKSCRNRGRA